MYVPCNIHLAKQENLRFLDRIIAKLRQVLTDVERQDLPEEIKLQLRRLEEHEHAQKRQQNASKAEGK